MEGAPPVTPDCCRQDNGVELLPLDAPFQLSYSPVTVEPLALAVSPEANGPGAVAEELEVGSGVPVGQEEGAAILRCGEFSPPSEVGLEWVRDVVEGGAKVDHPSEEGPTSWDDLGGKAEGTDKGEEFQFGAAVAICLGSEGAMDCLQFVGR